MASSAADRRKKMNEDLYKSTSGSFKSKDASGNWASYIMAEYHEKLWKPQGSDKGIRHVMDIVPFAAGDNYPIDILTKKRRVAEGDVVHLLDFWVHQNIGPSRNAFVCLAKTYGLDCPICADLLDKRQTGDYADDEMKKWPWAKRRVLYNVIVYDDAKEEAKGVQLLDMAHWNMELKLVELAQSEKGGVISFAHPDHGPTLGHTIKFTRKGTGKDDTQFYAHELAMRDYDLTDAELDAALALDQIITVPTEEEIINAYFGKDDKAPGGEERGSRTNPSEGRSSRHVQEAEEGQDPPPPEEEPEQTRGRSSRQPEESKTDKEEKVGTNECPHGHDFGKDIESTPDCKDCKKWEPCFEKERELKKAARQSGGAVEEKEEKKKEPEPATSRRHQESALAPSGSARSRLRR